MAALVPRSNIADQMANFRFYYYEPSMTAAILFTILFGLTTLVHAFQLVRSKTWFMIPFLIGGIFECVGYIGRVLSALENPGPYDKIPYIIQSLLLLIAPPFFAASIYMELGRVVAMVDGEKKLFIRRTWLTKTFVIGDVVTFLVQATGSSMMASSDPDRVSMAHYIVIGGLFLQILFFGLFVVAATTFHARLAPSPTQTALERPWTKHMISLYVVSMLILIRSIVRALGFTQGYDGYIMTHEVFLYCFDAALMFIAMVMMNIVHPAEVARYLRGDRAGSKAEKHRFNAVEYTAV